MKVNNSDDLVLIRSGNDRDKNKLFEKYNKLIYGFFLKKTKDIDIAQDLTQDMLMKLNDKLKEYNEVYPFNVWVYKMINNHLCDYYRLNNSKRRKLERTFLDINAPKNHDISGTSINFVLDELDNKNMLDIINSKAKYILNDTEYNVYDLKFVKDYTYNELEEVLNIDRKKIIYVVSTIRKKFRNHLRAI
jgi:RNA polymerase sigma factor (sigma-70 family)